MLRLPRFLLHLYRILLESFRVQILKKYVVLPPTVGLGVEPWLFMMREHEICSLLIPRPTRFVKQKILVELFIPHWLLVVVHNLQIFGKQSKEVSIFQESEASADSRLKLAPGFSI
ncbi:hypothetical protein OPV22_035146 [Ensete ventricosum]|uniref:Uncharacterized protein n=1 Tax=Ensete ventricosum TaxID=4639 RepID=A0AAX5NE99_ENSVE|nr:hypothetical protein OPV22_035146 [Ensete ventricosum]